MSFRADATFGVSLLRSFIVSSVQICAWASIASGFGIVGLLPINVMAGRCPCKSSILGTSTKARFHADRQKRPRRSPQTQTRVPNPDRHAREGGHPVFTNP